MQSRTTAVLGAALLLAVATGAGSRRVAAADWPVYGGDKAGTRYSPLTQIDRNNVVQLQEIWRFEGGGTGETETSPLIIGRILYAFTASMNVVALDAATGKLLWKFDSGLRASGAHRGLSWWSNGRESRLFAGIMNVLYALDPATGKPIASFGDEGGVDLRYGLGGDPAKHFLVMSSPGMVYGDLIIVGFRTVEVAPAPAGDIRAFDVRTGALRWTFHTIPHPGEFGYDTWPRDAWKNAGAANNWAGMTIDTQRGVVYVPTGSAVFDFYGGNRAGDDLFADSLIALDAETGKRLWHFQGVHHDLWDRDFPAPPALLTVTHDGKRIDAIAQTTKSGYVFVLDRTTGKPLFPLKESEYPASNVPGEVTSRTQWLPTLPEPYVQQSVTEDTLTNRTPEAHAWSLKQFKTFIAGGQFVPPSVDK